MTDERRRRIKFLKKMIITTLIVAILLPYVFCLLLFFQLMGMNDKMDRQKETSPTACIVPPGRGFCKAVAKRNVCFVSISC